MGSKSEPYRIVVGYDFTELSDIALRGALALAGTTPGTELHIVGVINKGLGPFHSKTKVETAGHVADALRSTLRELITHTKSAPVPCFEHVLFGADAATQLVHLAIDENADVIVVGTRGRHGVDRIMRRSVAEAVVRDAHCPVLVMRPKTQHARAEIEPPCPLCLHVREASAGAALWCEQHSKPAHDPHLYGGSGRRGSTAAGMGDWSAYNH